MAGYDQNQISFMRTAIKTVYGKGRLSKWTTRCDKMPDKQVVAVYYSFKERKLL